VTAEGKDAIRKALRETLAKELGADALKTPIGGPWGMVIGAHNTWEAPARLNHELFLQLRGQFSDDMIREILLAAAGIKVSRTCLSDSKLELLQNIAFRYGFNLVASKARFIPHRDKGKGGWSNSIDRVIGHNETSGLRNVYIARDASLAEAGLLLEEAGMDELFGALLGVPPCCREKYERFQAAAQAKQNDFVSLVLENTPGSIPYDPWLNYMAQYFGRSMLSFFPCSFRCPAANIAAKSTFEMLLGCDATWAYSFLELHHTNILYTENLGLHLFRQPLRDGSILYGPDDVDSTEPTEVATLIRRGDRLEVRGKRQVTIYHGSKQIGTLEGEDVGMCVFWSGVSACTMASTSTDAARRCASRQSASGRSDPWRADEGRSR
jgi:hypothetical protein